MSDNIISFSTAGRGGSGGDTLAARVGLLETKTEALISNVQRLEVAVSRLDGRIDTLTERLHAHGETLTDVKSAVRDLGTKIDAKVGGAWQMFGIFTGLFALVIAAAGAALSIVQHFGLLSK